MHIHYFDIVVLHDIPRIICSHYFDIILHTTQNIFFDVMYNNSCLNESNGSLGSPDSQSKRHGVGKLVVGDWVPP